jgi:hypothetical protein
MWFYLVSSKTLANHSNAEKIYESMTVKYTKKQSQLDLKMIKVESYK